jgi:thiamine biosynthesis lipoprotein
MRVGICATRAIPAVLAFVAMAVAIPVAGTIAAPPQSRSVAYGIRTMGTWGRVVLVTSDSVAAEPTARRALAAFTRVDSLMSNWTRTSEVARINALAGEGPTVVHPEVAGVLAAALDLWRDSEGAYDITVEPLVRLWGFLGGPRRVPADAEITAALARVGADKVRFDPAARTVAFSATGVRVDLGGIAKGHAVDAAAETLRAHGVRDALVDLTGNMVALGSPPGAAHWRIGIRDPRDRMPHFARLAVDGAVSTSGQYEQFVAANGRRYGHILDPRTGRPVDGLISVTVVARTALLCDAWDTPLFVLGPERARRKARSREDIAAVLVEPGPAGVDTVWVEEALRDRFTLEPAARDLFVVRWF